MPLAEDNDMVKAIPPDRTDEPLRMSVLPWRSWCDRPVPNAHRANATINSDILMHFSDRGNTRYVMGDYRSAIADYNRAIEIDPDYSQAYGAARLGLPLPG